MTTDPHELAHDRNLPGYLRQIDELFAELTKEAAALAARLNVPQDAERAFRFSDYPQAKRRIEELFETLRSGMSAVVVNGINAEWALANDKGDALCREAFGEAAEHLTDEQRARYFNNHAEALQAFRDRKTAGLNLSDRVWRYTDGAKAEIEAALDCAIRDGVPAESMARELKQYLRHPDKLFRRVRDAQGLLQLSKAARAFHPGTGVYRSSYMNARRLAATETNIAYRTADHTRVQDLDFVVGIEICLSNNHTVKLQAGERIDPGDPLYKDPYFRSKSIRKDGTPKAGAVRSLHDICDDLAGRYPKTFKFTGWHPHCRCHVITILKTREEMDEDNRRIMRGEEPTTTSRNAVQNPPQQFRDWVKDNAERMKRAEKRGALPYFLRDNYHEAEGDTQHRSYLYGSGKVKTHMLVSTGDSDYKKLVQIAEYFARAGKTATLTPKTTRPPKFEYKDIYGSLVGTKYEGKCPDLNVDGVWYEHEGFITDNPKRALKNMLNDGLKQSCRIIIDQPELTDRYILHNILTRSRAGQEIRELWIRNKDRTMRLLYEKKAGGSE